MLKAQFIDIMGALGYTDIAQPLLFKDRFHKVRQMILVFNKHYERDYSSPAWLSCLDESMNCWLIKFCLGFMICPRKPWPFRNEYHSITNSDENMQHSIMWRVRFIKEKDRPAQFGHQYRDTKGTLGWEIRRKSAGIPQNSGFRSFF
jgi:hypothetical protein